MGPKKNRQEKAARRNAKANARRQRASKNQENTEDFEDDVPKMRYQLERLGLALKDVEGDGNCVFRALSDQLYGTPGRYQHLRKETVQFMRANKADFEPFHSDGPFDRHLDLLAEDATYAGNDALVAFARARNVTIVIHQLNEPLWQIHGGPDGQKCDNELHISYHNGDHYNSIRRFGQLNIPSPPAIKINVASNGDTDKSSEQSYSNGDKAGQQQGQEQDREESDEDDSGVAPAGNAGIWSAGGTGSRIFGKEIREEAGGGRKLSAKTRKKQSIRERQNAPSSVDVDVPAMQALSL